MWNVPGFPSVGHMYISDIPPAGVQKFMVCGPHGVILTAGDISLIYTFWLWFTLLSSGCQLLSVSKLPFLFVDIRHLFILPVS